MPDSEVKIETTTCPRCKTTLKVTVGTQAKTPWTAEREFRNVESCQSCIQADRNARIENEYKVNRGKFFRECGLDKRYWSGEHLPAMSLNPKTLKILGIREDGNNAQGFSLLRQWVESDYGCLYCYGVQGSGKTCAAVAATIDCVNRPHPQEVQFLTEREIIGTYSRSSKFDISLIERAFDVEVLVLRQKTTKTSGYHTKYRDMRRILLDGIGLAEKAALR